MLNYDKKQNKKTIIAGGEYGEIFWEIDSERTLSIWGDGDIPHVWGELPPWYPYERGGDAGDPFEIKRIIVKKGVKSIGESAFNGLIHVEEAEIPEGVKKIGDCAFHECKRLKK
ncbi:MAG: leucine-rich repeat protein [Firmicutes bacterium]|nr:leucine-rich repeat protein [Bacillota bacterium]MBR0105100.1 leucine-rich repeat protein [Bacillota bacterium]